MTRRAKRVDQENDPHGVAKAKAGTVTCVCGERFTGHSTGESWDMYYSHWVFWGNSTTWQPFSERVQ